MAQETRFFSCPYCVSLAARSHCKKQSREMQKLACLIVLAAVASISSGLRVSLPVTRISAQLKVSPTFSTTPQLQKFESSHPALYLAAGDSTVVATLSKDEDLKKRLKIGGLFGLWYALNIGYNVYNKKVLNLVPNLTYTVAFLQLFLGLFYVLPVWGLKIRAGPELSKDDWISLLPIGLLHSLTHLGAVVSLGAGAVSFTHIVKAAEPAVSAAISAIFLKSFMPLPVYASLIPVMGGVALASATELSFTWLGFGAAMVSNLASALRGIVGKTTLGKPVGKNMDAANVYGIMTILATLMCFPVALLIEGQQIVPTLKKFAAAGKLTTLLSQTLLSGIFYYLYNEVAFLALDNVAPVTHAIGNTIKRVVIIIASVLVFGTTMTSQGILGSAIAIGGVLLYSLAKNKFK